MGNAQFVDISAFQPANIDWNAYREWSKQGDGLSRVAMRSSYGTGFTDQHFYQYRQNALNAGIDQLIIYHYGYPQYNNPQGEADFQYNVVGPVRDQDIIILDYEENVPEATAEWAYAWLIAQQANYGHKVGIYSYPDFIFNHLQDFRLASFPLWYADWTFNASNRPSAPAPWTRYAWLQYADNAQNIPGINATVDINVFTGGLMTPQEIDAQNLWNSTAPLFGGTPLPYNTGIATVWKEKRIGQSILMPPPTTPEFMSVDWNGTQVICQVFGIIQAAWYADGTCKWYNLNGGF